MSIAAPHACSDQLVESGDVAAVVAADEIPNGDVTVVLVDVVADVAADVLRDVGVVVDVARAVGALARPVRPSGVRVVAAHRPVGRLDLGEPVRASRDHGARVIVHPSVHVVRPRRRVGADEPSPGDHRDRGAHARDRPHLSSQPLHLLWIGEGGRTMQASGRTSGRSVTDLTSAACWSGDVRAHPAPRCAPSASRRRRSPSPRATAPRRGPATASEPGASSDFIRQGASNSVLVTVPCSQVSTSRISPSRGARPSSASGSADASPSRKTTLDGITAALHSEPASAGPNPST